MSNGDLKGRPVQASQFSILRTFSTVKPGKMAEFMNAITWQAAWLRHFFHWDRVVVGYALTDVPERVLEVYGIPEADLANARKVLDSLHAQEEYKRLSECCQSPREEDEELLPAMQFKTFLNGIVEILAQERAVAEDKKRTEQALERSQAELRRLENEETAARQTRTSLNQQLSNVVSQIEQANRRDVISTNTSQSAQSSQDIDNIALAAVDVRELERQRVDLQSKLDRVESRLRQIPEERRAEQDLSRGLNGELEGLIAEIEEAQDPEQRERKFQDLRIPAYFLNVTIRVKPGLLPEFEEKMKRLTDDFKWEFIAAGQHSPIGEENQRPIPGDEIMHLWKFGDANDLYRQMVELRENQRFADIERLTSQQTHMLMCDWEALSNTKRPPPFPEVLA